MSIKIYKSEDFTPSRWTGGTTTQLAIFPQDADYVKRNFIWRLSTATCDLEETTFSKLPDYDRVLMVLKGDVVLAHQDVRVARLGELEQDRFDGGYITKSFGKITDYNLMTAKGNKGYLDVIELTAESRELEFEQDEEYMFNLFSMLTMPILHGFSIYKAHNCMSFISMILTKIHGIYLEKPYYKYMPSELNEVLKEYVWFEGWLKKKEESVTAKADSIPGRWEMCVVNCRIIAELIYRMIRYPVYK